MYKININVYYDTFYWYKIILVGKYVQCSSISHIILWDTYTYTDGAWSLEFSWNKSEGWIKYPIKTPFSRKVLKFFQRVLFCNRFLIFMILRRRTWKFDSDVYQIIWSGPTNQHSGTWLMPTSPNGRRETNRWKECRRETRLISFCQVTDTLKQHCRSSFQY